MIYDVKHQKPRVILPALHKPENASEHSLDKITIFKDEKLHDLSNEGEFNMQFMKYSLLRVQ